MAVPELMRILLDEAHLGWDQAWDLTQRTLAYTNHTLLPEALEKWPVAWFEMLLPRHLEIIYEINRRLLDVVRVRYPGDEGRVARVSLIEEGPTKHVRMANLAIVGSHSTNGVAAIHTKLLRTTTVKDLAEMFPERFSNKTNGVTPRRWLLLANPMLARTITETIGDDWITDLSQLSKLKPLADEKDLRIAFSKAKREAKAQFATWLQTTSGQTVDAETIFDCQIKRIHEYKRQLLNVLRIVVLYNRLRANPSLKMAPRTFFFAGKAAPAYHLAKVIIKFINNLANIIDSDPVAQGKIKVLFLPEYDVTLAERLIPASDVSNQISTAGYEASGTSNMKFMMNGALTVGTRDGATIEMAEEAGEENFFLFGLTAEQVASSRGWYNPRWHYEHDSETRAALDLIFSDYFSRHEPGVFAPLRDVLLTHGDYYMHLADLKSYLDADQRLDELYADPHGWARKVDLECGRLGKILQRPHDRRVRDRHLERGAMSSALIQRSIASNKTALDGMADGEGRCRAFGYLCEISGFNFEYRLMNGTLPIVYLARHGETAWSLTGQHTGLTDLPLTERGERNARSLGERLKGLTFSMVATSPLKRAARTCELSGFKARAEIDRDLLEWDYGQYEGRQTVEIHAARPDWQLFRDGCPGGESPDQVGARADRVVSRAARFQGDVLLFSSGHFLRRAGRPMARSESRGRQVFLAEHGKPQCARLRT